MDFPLNLGCHEVAQNKPSIDKIPERDLGKVFAFLLPRRILQRSPWSGDIRRYLEETKELRRETHKLSQRIQSPSEDSHNLMMRLGESVITWPPNIIMSQWDWIPRVLHCHKLLRLPATTKKRHVMWGMVYEIGVPGLISMLTCGTPQLKVCWYSHLILFIITMNPSDLKLCSPTSLS